MSTHGPIFTNKIEEIVAGIENYGLSEESVELPLEELRTATIIGREDKSRLTLTRKIITLELPSGARYKLNIEYEQYSYEDDPILTLEKVEQ